MIWKRLKITGLSHGYWQLNSTLSPFVLLEIWGESSETSNHVVGSGNLSQLLDQVRKPPLLTNDIFISLNTYTPNGLGSCEPGPTLSVLYIVLCCSRRLHWALFSQSRTACILYMTELCWSTLHYLTISPQYFYFWNIEKICNKYVITC